MWELVNKPSPSNDLLHTIAHAQDRAIGMASPRTVFTSLEVPVNAISTNRDFTQVVAGGRNVFKILGITDGFTEKMNLRVGRINLNFSIIDVLWHHLDDNTIATAAGNGAVALWDLSRLSKTKQKYVFTDHKRTVNKICFHPTDANILLSGSQDGTINFFDIRKKCVATKFFGQAGIRDVQFSPFDRNLFAAARESGNIELWDLRKPEHFLLQFAGHFGPVFSIDWHPEDRSWLGTGGRDKTIKVWNIQSKGACIHSVPTIAEVACVRWRPKEKFHIASCSLVVDHHVSVWDIRRPYIPFAAFTEHDDVATDIIWHKESEMLLSCSKDCTLYQHVFQDALRPAEHAPPVGLGVSIKGDICNACSDQIEGPSADLRRISVSNRPSSHQVHAMPAFFKKAPSTEYDFKSVHSTLSLYNCEDILNEVNIEKLAKAMIFSGKPFPEICSQNARVCQDFGLFQKCQTWLILKNLFSEIKDDEINCTSSTNHPSSSETFNRGSVLDSVVEGNIDVDNDSSESLDDDVYTGINKANEIDLTVGADFDAIFQDDQFDGQLFSSEAISEDIQDWNLPSEAFQPRHSIGEQPLAIDQSQPHDPSSSPIPADNPSPHFDTEQQKADQTDRSFHQSKYLFLPEWEFKPLIIDMLKFFAERGDVQMAVTVLLALQDRIGDEIDMATKEEWFFAYLDLLNRFQLWTIANRIIKLSNIPSISMLNQNSTNINTLCGGCKKPMPSASGWYCKNCQKNAAPCSVCHLPVKGLYVWCQGCGHGGHLIHMNEWIEKNRQCPAGCGHRCEYS